jgi:hypothetical protein
MLLPGATVDGRFDRVSTAKAAILRHLKLHPRACDSVVGIQSWWLADYELEEIDVLAAVEQLVREGQMDMRRLPDGSKVYGTHQRP